MHRALAAASGFGVSILASDQGALARDFARPGDRFAGVGHVPGRQGLHLRGAIAHLHCAVHDIRDGGDHVIVIGRVDALAVHAGEPLLYAQGAFLDLPAPGWERAAATAAQEWLLSARSPAGSGGSADRRPGRAARARRRSPGRGRAHAAPPGAPAAGSPTPRRRPARHAP